jgi:glycosyltransferase involved in cell wall biosynthesis
MAVYNGAQVIRTTVDSILNQTFRDFEFIIVDDCSRDDTVKIIESYNDPRIVLLKNSVNCGQTKSLNTGLRASRGEYIARTDAGDISFPQRLEKQVAFLDKHPDVAVLGASAIRYNEEGRIMDVVHMPTRERAIKQRLLVTTPVVHISVMMRRDVIIPLGGYDDDYYVLADYELWSRLVINGRKLANIREVLAGYMVSSASFGARNAEGRSLDEACLITQRVARECAGIEIGSDQSKKIRLMFEFSMLGLSMTDIEETERLFSYILSRIADSKSEASYYLLKAYLGQLSKKENRRGFTAFLLKSALTKAGCCILSPSFFNEIYKKCDSLAWKAKNRNKALFL